MGDKIIKRYDFPEIIKQQVPELGMDSFTISLPKNIELPFYRLRVGSIKKDGDEINSTSFLTCDQNVKSKVFADSVANKIIGLPKTDNSIYSQSSSLSDGSSVIEFYIVGKERGSRFFNNPLTTPLKESYYVSKHEAEFVFTLDREWILPVYIYDPDAMSAWWISGFANNQILSTDAYFWDWFLKNSPNVEKVDGHFEVNVCNRLGETTTLTFMGTKEEIGKFDLMSIRFV